MPLASVSLTLHIRRNRQNGRCDLKASVNVEIQHKLFQSTYQAEANKQIIQACIAYNLRPGIQSRKRQQTRKSREDDLRCQNSPRTGMPGGHS